MNASPPAPPDPRPGAWFVYVLWSAALARTYVGIATDVRRRLRQHGGEIVGGARATRAGRPWALAACYGPFPDRGAATRAELSVKALRGAARFRWTGPRESGHEPGQESGQEPGLEPACATVPGADTSG